MAMAVSEIGGGGFTENSFFDVDIGGVVVGVYGEYFLPIVVSLPSTPSAKEAALDLAIPPGAVVTQVNATITGAAPGRTKIGQVATVRAAAGAPASASKSLVVDFAGLRTASSLEVPSGLDITAITPWVGTKFQGFVTLIGSGAWVDFTEIQTERLLVTLDQAADPATVAETGHVTTTTPPSDLELTVAGTRVWLRPGPTPAGFTETVDITAAVQAAVDAGGSVDAAGNLTIRLLLTARVPGQIGLALGETRYLRTHTVDFPGPTTTVRFAEEGEALLTLPLPAGHEAWLVQQVVATVGADDAGPLRVLPPTGPAPSTEAELVLDTDRRLCVRVPPAPLGRMALLHGVRLLLAPGPAGVEIDGSLLRGTDTEPGDAVPDVVLGPATVPASSSPTWVSVRFGQPVEPPAEGSTWIALSVTRGDAVVALAHPGALIADDAILRRIAPNGVAQVPSSAVLERESAAASAIAVRTDLLALRVVGEAPDEAPIELVHVDLVGGAEVADVGPGTIALAIDPPAPRPTLSLALTATAATTVTVGPVVVAYTESGGPP